MFSGVTAWGVKLLCSAVDTYLLPEFNRLWLGCVLSFSILWARCRHLTSKISQMLTSSVTMIFFLQLELVMTDQRVAASEWVNCKTSQI